MMYSMMRCLRSQQTKFWVEYRKRLRVRYLSPGRLLYISRGTGKGTCTTWHVSPMKTQISLHIHTACSWSLRCPFEELFGPWLPIEHLAKHMFNRLHHNNAFEKPCSKYYGKWSICSKRANALFRGGYRL